MFKIHQSLKFVFFDIASRGVKVKMVNNRFSTVFIYSLGFNIFVLKCTGTICVVRKVIKEPRKKIVKVISANFFSSDKVFHLSIVDIGFYRDF